MTREHDVEIDAAIDDIARSMTAGAIPDVTARVSRRLGGGRTRLSMAWPVVATCALALSIGIAIWTSYQPERIERPQPVTPTVMRPANTDRREATVVSRTDRSAARHRPQAPALTATEPWAGMPPSFESLVITPIEIETLVVEQRPIEPVGIDELHVSPIHILSLAPAEEPR